MRGVLRFLVVLLPLVGLAWSWQATRSSAEAGQEWDVPVAGYDPRDLLRGHYLRYNYAWPGMAADLADGPVLCLIGTAPRIDTAYALTEGASARHCDGVVRAQANVTGLRALREGRLYLPEAEAIRLQTALRDPRQQGMLRIRLHRGAISPVRLTVVPQAPAVSESASR